MNVLLVVLDACRLEALKREARFVSELAENNVECTNAVTPSRWSLPSHVSLFTGEYPSEHGIVSPFDAVDDLELTNRLAELGYEARAVSANAFVSETHGFDCPFDGFHYTLRRGFYPGVEPYGLDTSSDRAGPLGTVTAGVQSVLSALQSKHPLNTLGNVGIAAVETLSPIGLGRYHRLFGDRLFQYSPSRNTDIITDRLAAADDPLFLFSNYMDTHSPYWPAEQYQRETLDRTVGYEEAVRLNEEVMLPFPFAAASARGAVDEQDLQTVRALYDAAVRSADDHISRLVDALQREELWDDTLLVVTADHGEVLGERDELGNERMGHVDSISDHLLQVPLVLAGGDVASETVTDYVSLTDLPDVLIDYCRSGTVDTDRLTSERAVTEIPATEQEDLYDEYPTAPTDMIDRTVAEHTVVGYESDWKVVVRSHREDIALRDGSRRSLGEAPDELVSALSDRIESLEARSSVGRDGVELDENTRDDLSDLGYL